MARTVPPVRGTNSSRPPSRKVRQRANPHTVARTTRRARPGTNDASFGSEYTRRRSAASSDARRAPTKPRRIGRVAMPITRMYDNTSITVVGTTRRSADSRREPDASEAVDASVTVVSDVNARSNRSFSAERRQGSFLLGASARSDRNCARGSVLSGAAPGASVFSGLGRWSSDNTTRLPQDSE